MKILMLNYEFPPLGGGAANACSYIVREMADRGVAVDLVTSSASGSFETERVGQTVAVYRLPVGKRRIHYWTQREILSYSWKARRFAAGLLKKNGYSLCHAFFGIPCGAIAYSFRKELPYIVSLRGSDVPGFNRRFSAQYALLRPLIRAVWRSARAVVANSQGLMELARETDGSCPIDIIYNGIDVQQFRPDGADRDRPRLLCVSRLVERKGIDHLLRSVAALKGSVGDSFELWVVGEGNLEAQLRALAGELGIADIVSFRGYIEHDSLPPVYASSDVFVMPSLSEGMSNTVLEAMACGLPLVVTDTGGSRELVKDNGVVVPAADAGALADAIGRLLAQPSLGRQMGLRSRELATGFSWGAVADGYLGVYRSALGLE